jgi:hypothetical protein
MGCGGRRSRWPNRCRRVGDVGQPQLVRPVSHEAAVHQVRRPGGTAVWDGREALLASLYTPKAHVAHQPADGAAGDPIALAVQLLMDPTGPVAAVVGFPHPADLDLVGLIGDRPWRGRADLRRVKVRSGSSIAAHIGATGQRCRCSSTKPTMTVTSGRPPSRKNWSAP